MKFPKIKIKLILSALLLSSCANKAPTTVQPTPAAKSNANTTSKTTTSANAPLDITVVNSAPEVPYVPTHEIIVDEMLKVAEVKGTDVLWDLGSGDGRIPVTAAKRFGTRGVGVDIDPQRIKEANENAKKNGVSDKVKFIEGDLFDVDFSEATVVTLYLLPDVNMRLRPKLLSSLKPGTRVVSHNYDMGDWQPEQTKVVKTPDNATHYVYFWRVPEKK